MAGWHDFFVAQASVAGALLGLLFVAVSINLARVLEFKQLPTRAAETLIMFFIVLVVAAMALVPDQSDLVLGCEVAGAAVFGWTVETVALVRTRDAERGSAWYLRRVLLNQLPLLSYVIAGVGLALGHPGCAIWFLPGTLLCFAAGLAGTWVLLIEIQR